MFAGKLPILSSKSYRDKISLISQEMILFHFFFIHQTRPGLDITKSAHLIKYLFVRGVAAPPTDHSIWFYRYAGHDRPRGRTDAFIKTKGRMILILIDDSVISSRACEFLWELVMFFFLLLYVMWYSCVEVQLIVACFQANRGVKVWFTIGRNHCMSRVCWSHYMLKLNSIV